MSILYDILHDGYFPRELPPPFNTKGFANLILAKDYLYQVNIYPETP